MAHLKYYGYYFWYYDDVIDKLDEVSSFTNIIHTRIDTTPTGLRWDDNVASRIKNTGQKMIVQLPIEAHESWLTDPGERMAFLQTCRKLLEDANSLSSVAYIELYEEWYTSLIPGGFFDKWTVMRGKTHNEQYIIIKQYLEAAIADTKKVFPGIPVTITEVSVKRAAGISGHPYNYPVDPPSNLDVISLDAYFMPTNGSCDSTQRARFDSYVTVAYNAAMTYGKPIIMVGQAFSTQDWPLMPSRCQMEWFYDVAKYTYYRIETFVWFIYPDTDDIIGVRDYPDSVDYQKQVGEQILNSPPCQGDCALYISQDIPIFMIPGHIYPISISMKNTGTNVWTWSNRYGIELTNYRNQFILDPVRVELPVNSSVYPGQEVKFNFKIIAPIYPGSYDLQWRMIHRVIWFGEYTPNVNVKVINNAHDDKVEFLSH